MLLTDPQVLSLEAGFGPGDLSACGMKACLTSHRCGPTCKKLQLAPMSTKALHRLFPTEQPLATPGSSLKPPSAFTGSDWERVSESDLSEQWDKVSNQNLDGFSFF